MTYLRTSILASAFPDKRKRTGAQPFVTVSFFTLFWIFVVASVAGLAVETVVAAIMDGFVKDRAGLVWGPFSPLYGLGAVVFTIALNNLRGRNPLLLFATAAVVGGALEFAAGWFWKNAFGIIAWSYIDRPLNFGGFTCAEIMVVWGIAGCAWMHAGLPLVMRLIDAIPRNGRTAATAIAAAFMAVNIAVTLLALNCWFERLSGEPAETPTQRYFEAHYGNEWMRNRFETMGIWTDLAQR